MHDKFWEHIIATYSLTSPEPVDSTQSYDVLISNLFSDPNQAGTQKHVLDALFSEKNSLEKLACLGQEPQKLIIINALKNHPPVRENVAFLILAFEKLGTRVLQEIMKDCDLKKDSNISNAVLQAMLEACPTSEVWDLYFHLVEIEFTPTSDSTRFFEDLKKPEHQAALTHLIPHLLKYTPNNPDLLHLLLQNLNLIPIGEIVLLKNHSDFSKHPSYSSFFPDLKDKMCRTDKDGNNALMLAAYNQPTAIPDLLKAISTLDTYSQKYILGQTDKWGNNALMIAAYNQPTAIPDLLKAISTLDTYSQKYILGQTDADCMTRMLMLAAQYQPTALPALLNAISKLDTYSQKYNILRQTDEWGNNALMLAARYQPTALPALLNAIYKFDTDSQKNILMQKNGWGENALMIAAQNQPTAIPDLLKAIATLDIYYRKDILTKKNNEGKNALMIAAQNQPTAIPDLLKAIATLDTDSQKYILLMQINSDHYNTLRGYNALMIAARYQPTAIPGLLKAIATLDTDSQKNILRQTDVWSYNALMLAAYHQPTAIPDLLKAIATLDTDSQKNILRQTDVWSYNALMLAAYHQPTAIPSLLEAVMRQELETQRCGVLNILDIKHTKKDYANFQILKHTYELNRWLESHKKALPPLLLRDFQNLIQYLKKTDYQPKDFQKTLLWRRSIATSISDYTVKRILSNLEILAVESEIKQIPWPNHPPYTNIKNKENIQSVLSTLAPESMIENGWDEFKSIFQTFPESWKEAYLHQCRISLNAEVYQEAYQSLQAVSVPNLETKNLQPSAPPEVAEAMPLTEEDKNLGGTPIVEVAPVTEAVISSAHTPNAQAVPADTPRATPLAETAEIKFWLKTNQKDNLLEAFRQLQDPQSIYEFILHMRKRRLLTDKNITAFHQWIQEKTDDKIRFHLYELTYLARQYELMAKQIQNSNATKVTALINLSQDLKKLSDGLELIHFHKNHHSSYEQLLDAHKKHIDFLNHFVTRFEQFQKTYPGILDFTSSLLSPNGTHLHTLSELLPRKPIPQIIEKPSSDQNNLKNETFLMNQVNTKDFSNIVQQHKAPLFFKAKNNKNKNLLLLALETKNIDKIHVVAETIYHLNQKDRNDILNTCNQRGYRLTSYIHKKDTFLSLLELERLALKLQSINPQDPNIQTLNELAIRLRANPEDYLEDIQNAKKQLRKNASWRQWLTGKYSKTDYGIGLFKESIDSLLDKIQKTIANQNNHLNKP